MKAYSQGDFGPPRRAYPLLRPSKRGSRSESAPPNAMSDAVSEPPPGATPLWKRAGRRFRRSPTIPLVSDRKAIDPMFGRVYSSTPSGRSADVVAIPVDSTAGTVQETARGGAYVSFSQVKYDFFSFEIPLVGRKVRARDAAVSLDASMSGTLAW